MKSSFSSVFYSPTAQEPYTVMECPPEIVAELEAGATLAIRGSHEDAAVLCTDSATYSIRQVQLSNTLLFVTPSSSAPSESQQLSSAFQIRFPATPVTSAHHIVDSHSSYLEITKIRPKLDRLMMLVTECPYEGFQEDLRRSRRSDTDSNSAKVFSMRDLLENVQANTIFKLSEAKVCRLYGEQILKQQPAAGVLLTHFLGLWRAAVPEVMNIHLDQLRGLYLLEGSVTAQTVKYFPKSILSSDPQQCFEDLFKIRKKWLKDDILPYVEDLASSEKERELLFLKNARTSKTNGATFYTAKFTAVER
eukprot:jgi/Hompol1/1199/HPOL_004540-RA